MTVLRSFRELDRAWAASYAAADALRLTLQQDVPRHDGEPQPKPIEEAAELAADVAALLEAGGERVALSVAGGDNALGDGAGALAFAQQRWLEATRLCCSLNSPRRLFDLDDFVHRHGDRWGGWWPLVLTGLDVLMPCVWETDVALAQCWSELTERGRVGIGAATVGTLHVARIPTTGDL